MNRVPRLAALFRVFFCASTGVYDKKRGASLDKALIIRYNKIYFMERYTQNGK